MKKEDVQKKLEEFGFSITLDKALMGVARRHVIHCEKTVKKLVEYYVDETPSTIKLIWAFYNNDLKMIESIADLENWLNEQ